MYTICLYTDRHTYIIYISIYTVYTCTCWNLCWKAHAVELSAFLFNGDAMAGLHLPGPSGSHREGGN